MAIQLPNLLAHRLTSVLTPVIAPVITSIALSSGIALAEPQPTSATAGLSFSTSGVISDRLDLQQQRACGNVDGLIDDQACKCL